MIRQRRSGNWSATVDVDSEASSIQAIFDNWTIDHTSKTITAPQGTYVIDTTLQIPDGWTLQGKGKKDGRIIFSKRQGKVSGWDPNVEFIVSCNGYANRNYKSYEAAERNALKLSAQRERSMNIYITNGEHIDLVVSVSPPWLEPTSTSTNDIYTLDSSTWDTSDVQFTGPVSSTDTSWVRQSWLRATKGKKSRVSGTTPVEKSREK